MKEMEVGLHICFYGTNIGCLALRMLVVGNFFFREFELERPSGLLRLIHKF